MKRIPENVIDEIRQRANIVDVIGQHVTLKKRGRSYVGKCPFHTDSDPSFTVRPEFGTFKCFGCGQAGTAISFLMKINGLSFPEAVEDLGSRYGVKVPRIDGPAGLPRSTRESMYELNNIASLFFQKNLQKLSAKDYPADYLASDRRLTQETIKRFELGFAPDSWDALIGHLRDKNQSLDLAEQVGLVSSKEEQRYFDKFRNRIVCPIIDQRGKVVGFSGRTLGEDRAKYINSTESPVFNKSKNFYALNLAYETIRKSGEVVVVEGNFDVIKLHQVGITNAVAALGTALTRDHVRLLARLAKRMILVFDGDDAGRKAAYRSMELFLENNIEPDLVTLEQGEDPDSFIEKYGPEALVKLLEKARPVVECFIMDEVNKANGSVQGKTSAANNVAKVLRQIEDPIRQRLYIQQLAERIGVSQDEIIQSMHRQKMSGGRFTQPDMESPDKPNLPPAEFALCQLMFLFPDKVLPNLTSKMADDFCNEELRAIAVHCLSEFERKGAVDPAGIATKFEDSGMQALVSDLVMSDPLATEETVVRVFQDSLLRINQAAEKRNRRLLFDQLSEAERTGDRDNVIRLQGQIQKMREHHNQKDVVSKR